MGKNNTGNWIALAALIVGIAACIVSVAIPEIRQFFRLDKTPTSIALQQAPTPMFSATPEWTSAPTSTQLPTSTATPTPTSTQPPASTATPAPTLTYTPMPPTRTPAPTPMYVPSSKESTRTPAPTPTRCTPGAVGSGSLTAVWDYTSNCEVKLVHEPSGDCWVWEADFYISARGGHASYTIDSSACYWNCMEQKFICRWRAKEGSSVTQKVVIGCLGCSPVTVAINQSAGRRGNTCVLNP